MLHVGSAYNPSYGSSSARYSSMTSHSRFQRTRSIRSEHPLDLYGPLDIEGSVRSDSSIKFDGEFVVRGKIDAYGAITMNGQVNSESVVPPSDPCSLRLLGIVITDCLVNRGSIKAYGNIKVNGSLTAR